LTPPSTRNAAPHQTSLVEIAGLFLKLGTVAFGGPAAHIAMMEDEVVVRRDWLTERQLLDAVAVGQVTPGPVFTTATFIGYILGEASGAVVSAVLLFRFRVNSAWLVAAGAIIGLLIRR
jgi:chromate transporter